MKSFREVLMLFPGWFILSVSLEWSYLDELLADLFLSLYYRTLLSTWCSILTLLMVDLTVARGEVEQRIRDKDLGGLDLIPICFSLELDLFCLFARWCAYLNMNFVGWSWHLKVVIETAGTVHFDVLTVYRRDGFEYCCHFESLNSLDEAQRGDIIYLLQKICVEDLVK